MNRSEAVSRIRNGEDPDKVLSEFERDLSGAGGCPGCGEREKCFRCKSADVIGDRLTMAAPLLVPLLVEQAKDWAIEAMRRRRGG